MSIYYYYSLFFLTVPYGNHGCSCGDINSAYLYIIDNEGVDTLYNYPYKSRVRVVTKVYRCMNEAGLSMFCAVFHSNCLVAILPSIVEPV